MRVRVIKRSADGWHIEIVPIEIDDYCPICGEPRGKPYGHNFCEDGEWYRCDRWDNPCGHIDSYVNCLREAEKIKRQERNNP